MNSRYWIKGLEKVVDELYHSAKKRAEKKGLSFNLSRTFIYQELHKGKCSQTGLPFCFEFNSPWRPSLDRVDSSLGYVEDNVQLVVLIYNLAKNDHSDFEVLQMAKALVENQVRGEAK